VPSYVVLPAIKLHSIPFVSQTPPCPPQAGGPEWCAGVHTLNDRALVRESDVSVGAVVVSKQGARSNSLLLTRVDVRLEGLDFGQNVAKRIRHYRQVALNPRQPLSFHAVFDEGRTI